jgi:hypothetical protein
VESNGKEMNKEGKKDRARDIIHRLFKNETITSDSAICSE